MKKMSWILVTETTGPQTLTDHAVVKEISAVVIFEVLRAIDINRLTPNDPYMGRTAPLTSKRRILYIYSTNTGTEYFKHAL